MRMVVISIIAIGLLGIAVLLIPQSEEPAESVPGRFEDFGVVGDFQFTNQDGVRFSSEELEGKVWLANFVFTSCAAECPILTRKMIEVRESLGADAEVAFVSFSVDPQSDTPERLTEYASRYGSTEKWDLLTGDPQELDTLIKTKFLLPVARDYHERTDIAATGFIHSNKMMVVDQSGKIRYFTDGMEPGSVERLTEAMRRLM